MSLPFKISFYISRQFLLAFFLVFAVITCIILLIDILELLRRSYDRDTGFGIILQMAIYKFPILLQKFTPFTVLIASLITLMQLTKSNELIVTRTAGISVWQFLIPIIFTSFIIGVFLVTIFNPIACSMSAKYERIENKFLKKRSNLLAISPSGLWLRQKPELNSNVGEIVIHALKASREDLKLSEVVIFEFTKDGKFNRRIDAKSAKLNQDFWELDNVILTTPHQPAKRLDSYKLPTDLNINQIQESFASPETISFWALPEFIKTLKESGFSAQKHKMYFYSLLLSPVFIASMVLIAAVFSLQLPRHGKTSLMVAGSVVTGFIIFFLADLVSAFGISGRIPLELAAATPVILNIVVGTGLMLHLEEG